MGSLKSYSPFQMMLSRLANLVVVRCEKSFRVWGSYSRAVVSIATTRVVRLPHPRHRRARTVRRSRLQEMMVPAAAPVPGAPVAASHPVAPPRVRAQLRRRHPPPLHRRVRVGLPAEVRPGTNNYFHPSLPRL